MVAPTDESGLSAPAPRVVGATPPATVVVDNVRVTFKVRPESARARLAALVRRSGPEVVAVDGVSLIAREGEVIGLVGRNGSGKSTLLRTIAGLMRPSSGIVYTSDKPSLLGVNAALMPDLSGQRNVVLGCLALGMSRKEVQAHYDDIVELAGIGSHMGFPMRTYSTGMGARLRFAIATAATPRVLLIDEALNAGDAEFRKRGEERINSMREQAGTVFLVSHGLPIIRATCTRAIWLERGQILREGDPDDVVRSYERWVERRTRLREQGERQRGEARS
ncbi:MAG: ABC transporter ATP-binding protein [Mycobacteriales bacterium]|nr:MAG: teichoic acid ABC transporter ATP-binding protein [Pseudonocardiales bacterium]